jgi:dienelactone hydrolase
MAEVVLFHHVAGLTGGVRSFAEQLRAGGHTVYTPDLFNGETAASIDDGLALVNRTGDQVLQERGDAALAALPQSLVYAGFSFGAATAQRLAQTRPGARGALLYEGCLPLTGPSWALGPWPDGLPAQIHGMDADPFFALEGDIDSAREIVDAAGPGIAELFTYPGDAHLFTDSSLPSYDKEATALVIKRSIAFLDRLG